MTTLFDKHEKPVLRDMQTEGAAFAACEEFEGYMYDIAESLSEDQWEEMLCTVRALYDEYFDLEREGFWGE